MAFTPLQYDGGKIKELVAKEGETISKFDALQFDAGLVKRAAAATVNVRFVSLQDVASAESGEKILALDVRGVEFEADCTNNTAQDQVGLANALTDHEEVDNTNTEGAGEDTFVITQLVGVAGDKKARGYFMDKIIGS
jgi:hypothetical protein